VSQPSTTDRQLLPRRSTVFSCPSFPVLAITGENLNALQPSAESCRPSSTHRRRFDFAKCLPQLYPPGNNTKQAPQYHHTPHILKSPSWPAIWPC
jgi:hypothetical protein